jgi:plastocyanin
MHMRKLAIVAMAFALALIAAACGGGSSSSSSEPSASSSGKTEVEMDDYYFDPKVIKGKPGDTIILELKNEGSTQHNFEIESQGVDQDVQPDDEAEVQVTIPKSGSVEFYCKFHKSQGMEGELEASGSSGSMGSGSSGTSTGSGSDYGSG